MDPPLGYASAICGSPPDTIRTDLQIPITFDDLAVGDVYEADGVPEIILTKEVPSGQDKVLILVYQPASGTFESVSYDVGEGPSGVSVRDLNDDDLLDFSVISAQSKTLSVFYQTAVGLCQQTLYPALGSRTAIPSATTSGTFRDDLAQGSNLLVVHSYDTPCNACLPQMTITGTVIDTVNCDWTQRQRGPFALHADGTPATANWGIWGIASGNLFPGSYDEVVLSYGIFDTSDYLDVDPYFREADHFGIAAVDSGVSLGQLTSIATESFFPVNDGHLFDIAVADLTEDGDADLIVGAGNAALQNFVSLRPSLGDSIGAWSDFIGISGHFHDVDVYDIDDDSHLDVLVTAAARDLIVGMGDGAGNISQVCRIGILGTCISSALADFDLNGDVDIATVVSFDQEQSIGALYLIRR